MQNLGYMIAFVVKKHTNTEITIQGIPVAGWDSLPLRRLLRQCHLLLISKAQEVLPMFLLQCRCRGLRMRPVPPQH